MKQFLIIILSVPFLAACQSIDKTDSNAHTIIDWVDFVKINGKQYESVYSAIIADPTFIGEEISEVAFHISDNVSNPGYQIKDGDAAFLDEGTKLHAVQNKPDMLAVKNNNTINGYRLYQTGNQSNWHYQDLDKRAINKIEMYTSSPPPQRLNKIENPSEIEKILTILDQRETKPSFRPSIENGDPDRYTVVFYTDQVIAQQYTLSYDGGTWYWHPWDTEVLPDKIETYLKVTSE
ncbi:hypothetical protein [Aquibacillus sediminis]|uniref:hypothetical protein n=1 Tax=Aquibacillus sediminis TaxID=2574734 RepID=UPI00110913DF|nr:hypothetical protein [Aquibacillus sediminis]